MKLFYLSEPGNKHKSLRLGEKPEDQVNSNTGLTGLIRRTRVTRVNTSLPASLGARGMASAGADGSTGSAGADRGAGRDGAGAEMEGAGAGVEADLDAGGAAAEMDLDAPETGTLEAPETWTQEEPATGTWTLLGPATGAWTSSPEALLQGAGAWL